MPSDSISGTPGPRRDHSLVVALWILGIVAAAELILTAVGFAPRIATSVRKTPTTQSSQTTSPSPAENQQASLSAGAIAESGLHPSDVALPSSMEKPLDKLLEKPFRQPPPDSASQDGSVMQILSAKIENSGEGSKTLQLAIKSRTREQIEVPQVKVQVYFYDEQGGEVLPSKAQVTSRWLSAPVNWEDGKPELLEVRYLSDASDPETRFAGYVVAIYYKGDLQDCRSEPTKLRKLFEPKYFIGLDES